MEGDVAAALLTEAELARLAAFTRIYTVARWFHPSDAALRADWDAVAVEAVPLVLAAESPPELADVLRSTFAPLVEDFEISTGALPPMVMRPAANPRWQWFHDGFKGMRRGTQGRYRIKLTSLGSGPVFAEELVGGLYVRFPLTAAHNGDETPEMVPHKGYAGKPEGWTPAGFDRNTRIAATLIAWGVFDQFYPYWDEVEIDWDAKLTEQLQRAAVAEDDVAFHDALRLMTHEVADGHAGVAYRPTDRAIAPLALDWVEDQIVVVVAPEGPGIAVGDIVTAIDGEEAQQRLSDLANSHISGSEQWRIMRSLEVMLLGPVDQQATLGIVRPDGSAATVALDRIPYQWATRPQAPRPEPITQMEPGILYVDLTRLTDVQLVEAADQMLAARGLVFDLRGRPDHNATFILSHLTDQPILSPNFKQPIYRLPDQAEVVYGSNPWRLAPLRPRLTENTVFLMDERAISYPESWLGTIKGNGLAQIVGSNSAGGNGDVTMFPVPGGYRLMFSGLKVVNWDGRVDHNIGIAPDVPVAITIEDIRQGRDAILDAGVSVVREGLAGG